LHVQEPKTFVLGCHIHGLLQRPYRCIHLLPPFAMYAALPRSDYYEGSVPRTRHHRAWRLTGCFVSGARLEVPAFTEKTLDALGGQLCPWQPWSPSSRDMTVDASTMSSAPVHRTSVNRISLHGPPNSAGRLSVQRVPSLTSSCVVNELRALHHGICGSLPPRTGELSSQAVHAVRLLQSVFPTSTEFTAPLLARPDPSR
jgi:hypothetical protein